MARNFNLSNRYLTGSAPITTGPLSMACWFKPVAGTDFGSLMVLGNSSAGHYVELGQRGNLAGDPFQGTYRDAVLNNSANSTTGWTSGVWSHACITANSSGHVAIYCDGGGKNTASANTVTLSGIDTLSVGCRYQNSVRDLYLNGDLAEAVIYNVQLSDAQVAMLAKGVSPLMVQPDAIVFYAPIVGRTSPEIDVVGGYNLTVTNSVVAVHPRMYYGASKILRLPASPPPASSYQPRHGATMLSGVAII